MLTDYVGVSLQRGSRVGLPVSIFLERNPKRISTRIPHAGLFTGLNQIPQIAIQISKY